MRNLVTTGSALASVLIGAIAWFVLYVIIGVTLWVSFVVWGAIAVVGILLALPLTASHVKKGDSHRQQSHRGPIGAR